jgi:hypothetical protein
MVLQEMREGRSFMERAFEHDLRCSYEGMEKETHSQINVGRDLHLHLLVHAGNLVKLGEATDELQMRIHI